MYTTFGEKVAACIVDVQKIVLPFYGNVGAVRQKSEYASDLVTDLDIAVEDFLTEKLKAIDSSIGFVGEERGGNREAERFWLVDPIDGTAHFIRGLPFCTTMLALISENEVVLSAIYDFVQGNLYFAEKGEGATVNGKKISVSTRPLKDSYISWETHLEKPENKKKFLELDHQCVPIKFVCAGYEYAMVASGKIEGRICFDGYGKDYDYAPGSLLVAEAGGRVTNIGKSTYTYQDCDSIATNPIVFKELTQGSRAIFPLLNK